MEKNILVVDEQGNQYGATYPKRAKGLVKKGRARFIDATTISLACPPSEYLEDNIMDNNKEYAAEITVRELLERIDVVQKDQQNLSEYLERIKNLSDIDVRGAINVPIVTRAHAMKDSIVAWQETNRQLLSMYKEMYEDIRPVKEKSEAEKLQEFIASMVENGKNAQGGMPMDYLEIVKQAKDIFMSLKNE